MTRPPDSLNSGYQRFRSKLLEKDMELFESLSDIQSPETMVITCADSRIDPNLIFNAAPGELFVIRNVANIIPSYEISCASSHCTLAALEYAVKILHVRRILVLGHSNCGGVAAALAIGKGQNIEENIVKWVDNLKPACKTVVDVDASQTKLEKISIQQSLNNLKVYPFVEKAILNSKLSLHGAWFNIEKANLHWIA
ncbi:MAG: carbonate dehydratase [Rhodospirillaceae bacterium]|nr:carbonate dehydratase [Rhodospirillaceae bacterium]|tara:strand:- start:1464 stop:2054 length:591 start_codon:yes stop_codon:yes gene_type:complete